MLFSKYSATILAIALLLSSGCGSGDKGPVRHRISGTVTFDGQPVPQGNILFSPDASKGNTGPAAYAKIVDGKYDTASEGAMSPTAGEYTVDIEGTAVQAPGEELAKKLFETYHTTLTVPEQDHVFDITVPGKK